jgi:hypothetical protein
MNAVGMTIVACGEYHVAIWLHTAADPPGPQWTAGVERVAELKKKLGGDVSKILTFAMSDGGAPSTVQRGQLFTDVLDGKGKVAGISSQLSNRLVRGITTAIFWLNPNFRAYPPEQLDLALEHLGLLEHRAKLLTAFQDLQKGLPPVQTLALVLEAAQKAAR